MEIMIPVTMVLKSEKSDVEPQQNFTSKVQIQMPKVQIMKEEQSQNEIFTFQQHESKNQRSQIFSENEQNSQIHQRSSISTQQKNFQLKFLTKQQQNFKKQHSKIECELQKKSTRSSLHAIPGHDDFEQQSESEKSHDKIITQKEMKNSRKKSTNQFNLKFQHDLLNESDQNYCKICLEEGFSNLSSQIQKNNLCRVCKCHDYVHIFCLQEWINHRDILNENIQVNQCEVCKQTYVFELSSETFLSFKILKRNFKNQPLTVIKKFFLAFFFFIVSVFGLYVLIELFVLSSQNGGYIRQILGMPYVTCVTIVIFLLFIVVLIFGIFTYTFVMDLCLDFKYKIKKSLTQQQSSKNLQTLFTEWK